MSKSLTSGPSTRKAVAPVQAIPKAHPVQRSGDSVRRRVTATAVPISKGHSTKGESK